MLQCSYALSAYTQLPATHCFHFTKIDVRSIRAARELAKKRATTSGRRCCRLKSKRALGGGRDLLDIQENHREDCFHMFYTATCCVCTIKNSAMRLCKIRMRGFCLFFMQCSPVRFAAALWLAKSSESAMSETTTGVDNGCNQRRRDFRA